jgi:hypothetical protein
MSSRNAASAGRFRSGNGLAGYHQIHDNARVTLSSQYRVVDTDVGRHQAMASRPRNLFALVLTLAICVGLTQAHWLVGGVVFFVYTAILTQFSKRYPIIDAVIVGAIGGVILFAMTFLHISYFLNFRNDISFALYGEQPSIWFRIARQCSFPAGAFIGSLLGYEIGRLLENADERTVLRGRRIGKGIAVCLWLAYAASIAYSLIGTWVKYPPVVIIYCVVVLLLLLFIGSVFGSTVAALTGRFKRPDAQN